MFKVFEVDYNEKAYLVGTVETLQAAKKLGKKAIKNSHGEFPVFISDGKKVVADIR